MYLPVSPSSDDSLYTTKLGRLFLLMPKSDSSVTGDSEVSLRASLFLLRKTWSAESKEIERAPFTLKSSSSRSDASDDDTVIGDEPETEKVKLE